MTVPHLHRADQTAAPPLLRVRDLRIDFAHPRPAVEGIDVTVGRGEIVALVGESGSGKSMTARAVIGLLPRGAVATGSIELEGREVLGASEEDLRRLRGAGVAMVFQEPQTAPNPVRTVGWQLREALRAHGAVSRAEARERAVALLRQVEIPDPETRVDHYPHQLSGGQKQRVVLALALANEPSLLLADEPTTALDVTVQAEILALLGRLRDETGAGVLLITHNMGVVARLAQRVVVLREGRVVEEAPVRRLFAEPEHPYTRQLLGAVPRLPSGSEPPTLAPPPEAGASAAALRLDDVRVVYPARRGQAAFTAVDGVTFEVRRGEVVGLVGESGSGKTTLGRAAAGLLPAAAGTVHVGGADLATLSARALRGVRRGLALVPQDPAASLDPRFTVARSIAEPLDVHRVGDAASRAARVSELLDAVRLDPGLAQRRPHQLSGGQRQRVALARGLALDPTLLIADEPTSALDVSIQAEVLELFTRLQRELGFACLFVSHDLAVVHQVSDRVVVLREGLVVEQGPAERVFGAPEHDYTRRLVAAVPEPVPAEEAQARRVS
ncbi:dipeptide ABC transporter ATP-binding protein [Nocardioides aequoreus]|uniref:dipeptide ABC transporter ATP-binding protein n=1 Tax=Nocardioides aequoreus TaxID=397278 RepID=UPI0004C4784E|nr:ABC transporter ATP-binding protein [Nocardioides aequoreus]